MTTELNDEVPAPHLENRLWPELAKVHEREAADPSTAPVSYWRRPGRRLVLAGAGSIAAAAVLIAGIAVVGPDGSGDNDSEADLAPKIIAATESALADSIEHEVTDEADIPGQPDMETWRDQTTAAVRILGYAVDGSGELSIDWGRVTPPSPDDGPPDPSEPILERSVDYCFEEHSVAEFRYAPGATDINASLARSVVDSLRDGSMKTDGTEVIEGRELVRVIDDQTPYVTWYVDPETYRPVLVVSEVDPDDDASMAYVSTIEYLPRTPGNLALLSPAEPPEHFEEVEELTRTDEVMPGCN